MGTFTLTKTLKNVNNKPLKAKIGTRYRLNTGDISSEYQYVYFNPNETKEVTVSNSTVSETNLLWLNMDAFWVAENNLKLCRRLLRYSSSIYNLTIEAPAYISNTWSTTEETILIKNPNKVNLTLSLTFYASFNTDSTTAGWRSYTHTVSISGGTTTSISLEANRYAPEEYSTSDDVEFTSFYLASARLLTTSTKDILSETSIALTVKPMGTPFWYYLTARSCAPAGGSFTIKNTLAGKGKFLTTYNYKLNSGATAYVGDIEEWTTPNASQTFNLTPPDGKQFTYLKLNRGEVYNIQKTNLIAVFNDSSSLSYGELLTTTLSSLNLTKAEPTGSARDTFAITIHNPNVFAVDLVYSCTTSAIKSDLTTVSAKVADSARKTLAANQSTTINFTCSQLTSATAILGTVDFSYGLCYVGGGLWESDWHSESYTLAQVGNPRSVVSSYSITSTDALNNKYSTNTTFTVTTGGNTGFVYSSFANLKNNTGGSAWSDGNLNNRHVISNTWTSMTNQTVTLFATFTYSDEDYPRAIIKQQSITAPTATWKVITPTFVSSDGINITFDLGAMASSGSLLPTGTAVKYYYKKSGASSWSTASGTVNSSQGDMYGRARVTLPCTYNNDGTSSVTVVVRATSTTGDNFTGEGTYGVTGTAKLAKDCTSQAYCVYINSATYTITNPNSIRAQIIWSSEFTSFNGSSYIEGPNHSSESFVLEPGASSTIVVTAANGCIFNTGKIIFGATLYGGGGSSLSPSGWMYSLGSSSAAYSFRYSGLSCYGSSSQTSQTQWTGSFTFSTPAENSWGEYSGYNSFAHLSSWTPDYTLTPTGGGDYKKSGGSYSSGTKYWYAVPKSTTTGFDVSSLSSTMYITPVGYYLWDVSSKTVSSPTQYKKLVAQNWYYYRTEVVSVSYYPYTKYYYWWGVQFSNPNSASLSVTLTGTYNSTGRTYTATKTVSGGTTAIEFGFYTTTTSTPSMSNMSLSFVYNGITFTTTP